MAQQKPDFEKFMSDPAFKDDREFLEKFIGATLERREAEARKKREADEQSAPTIWDRIFSGS